MAAALALAAPARARIVWGDVHAHSGFSADAVGDARDFYLRARDEAHLDFVVLSDHDIWISRSEWRELTRLVKFFNDPGHWFNGPPGTGLTACNVDTLTRDDILDALRARRCYGTDGERIVLDRRSARAGSRRGCHRCRALQKD